MQVDDSLKDHFVGTVVEKPLGSSENPIEIIQDGETLRTTQNLSKTHLELIANALQNENGKINDNSETVVYRIVYPEELNLKPLFAKHEKRGRPKKRPVVAKDKDPVVEKKEKPIKNARTRSGRITRPPKYIEQDFKRIETNEYDENEDELTTTEFTPLSTSQTADKEQPPKLLEPLGTHQRKRNISARYRCPKCQKAYLGRNRMLRHLQDNPDHGPIPEHCKDNNFEAWNFLVDITQKCSIGNKGKKFCEELTNLLHNVKILARVLFKSSKDQKNAVKIDRVLGNALDLAPGEYKFNENELHKDVTVLSLLENSRFFEETYLNNENKSCNDSVQTNEPMNVSSDTKTNETFQNNSSYHSNNTMNQNKVNINSETIETNFNNFGSNSRTNENQETTAFQTNEERKAEHQLDSTISLHSDLLSHNSLLNSLPNLRTSVDDLILSGVDSGHVSNLLDNSTSSDEVMNVDQFVNERFKKITEPEIDLQNNSLNLDLPTLDLFQFHDS